MNSWNSGTGSESYNGEHYMQRQQELSNYDLSQKTRATDRIIIECPHCGKEPYE